MNIAMLLEMAADGLGDRVAFGSRDDGLTYARVRDLATGVGAHVARSGAHTVALVHETTRLTPVALFGAAWGGAAYAPLNYRLPEAARLELLHRLRPAEVADDAWLEIAPDAGHAFPDEPDHPAVLLFTSGSTAEPKAAVLHHDQLLAYQLNTVEFASADDDEAALVAVPPFHIAGVTAILSSTYAGRRIVPLPRFTAEDWLTTARAEAVTHAFVVPTMLARIVAAMEDDPDLRVPTLRHLAYGGARMPAPILARALRLFPNAGFVNAYGLTETSSTVSVLGPDDHRAALDGDPATQRRLSSVGQPVPGIEVLVVDDQGAAVPVDTSGEVLVRGAQVSGDYVGEGSQRDGDGWLHTGDRGRIDADGYLYIEGRGDDTIIRGGENISPAEVEDALLHHPAVASAAVVGLPDEEWGERVAAMVSLRANASATSDELRTFVHDMIGSLKTPETLEIRDELPHTATGKILRRQVKSELVDRQ
ncbi:MAG: long-chain fatty acid--CoA ligase [Acidimicrobiia bacterium]|nr:long-chain fatty acid--CoA ligase [Acidimicrobiia bacterium]